MDHATGLPAGSSSSGVEPVDLADPLGAALGTNVTGLWSNADPDRVSGAEQRSPTDQLERLRAAYLRIEGPLIDAYQGALKRLDTGALKRQARRISRAMRRAEGELEHLAQHPSEPSSAARIRELQASQPDMRERVLRAMGPGFGAPLPSGDIGDAIRVQFRTMERLVLRVRLMRQRLDRADRADTPEARSSARQYCAKTFETCAAESPAHVLFLQRALQRDGRFDEVVNARVGRGPSIGYRTVAALDSLGGPPRTVEGVFIQLRQLRREWTREQPHYPEIIARLDDIVTALKRMADRKRFNELRGQAGFGANALHLVFGAVDHVIALRRLAALGAGGSDRGAVWDRHVTSLEPAREPLEIVTGERPLAGSTIAAVDKASYVSLGAYAALFGTVVSGAALIELLPVLAAEAELLFEAGRCAYVWALQNPGAATELAMFLTGLGLEVADRGLLQTLEGMSTREGALMTLAEILVIRAGAGGGRGGVRRRPAGTPARSRPAGSGSAGRIRAKLDDLRVRATALKNWTRERIDVATVGVTPGGIAAPIPTRSLSQHVQDARQANMLRRRHGQGGGRRRRRSRDQRPKERKKRTHAEIEAAKRAKAERRTAHEARAEANLARRNEQRRARQEAIEKLKHVDQPLENTTKSRRSHGHGHRDHGYQTRLAAHKRRIETGKSPSGHRGRSGELPKKSAKFHSPEVELEVLEKARAKLRQMLQNTKIPTMEKGQPKRIYVKVATERPEGFGSGFKAKTDSAGEPIPHLDGGYQATQVKKIKSALVIFEYVPSQGKWIPATYYPHIN